MLYADQKEYITNIIHMGYTILVNTMQLTFLYFTHDYYLYLIIKVMMRLVENIVISSYVNRRYSYLLDNNVTKLDSKTEKDIFQKIKALFFHKIGTFIVSGTDNIIISKYLGLVTVGLYSNYYMIINAVQTVINHIIQATRASVGNLLVTESKTKHFDIFNKIHKNYDALDSVFSTVGGNILKNIALINGETINKFSGIATITFLTIPNP